MQVSFIFILDYLLVIVIAIFILFFVNENLDYIDAINRYVVQF